MKKAVAFCIKLGVTVFLFFLLFRPELFGLRPDQFGGITPGDLLREVQEAHAGGLVFWLSFALLVKLTGMLCGVLRWRILLKGQGVHIPFWYMVGSWFVGRTIGIFLPGTIGLDGYRLYDSARYTGEVIKCTTVIALEKLIGFIALTGLVFLTFPLGFRLLNINLPVLLIILTVLGSAVAVFFLLLLNPRVIQVLVAIIPTPKVIRAKLDKLGAAATAYSGSRAELLLACFFGLMVHAGTCFMYFGTMMAIRAGNTNLLDILFASPLMIYGTVLGPSVGGEGIREIVFVTLLGGKTSAAAAATFAHLGWWVGELVPFLIGLPIYVFRKRPGKEQLQRELADARAQAAAEEEPCLHFSPSQVAAYRSRVYACVASGVLAGLVAGACIGSAEAVWLRSTLTGLSEMAMFTWGPLVYGLLFTFPGAGLACALLFVYLLFDRFPRWWVTAALAFGGTLAAGGVVIGLWRFKRDVLAGHAATASDLAPVAAFVLGAALVGLVLFACVVWGLQWLLRDRPLPNVFAAVAAYAGIVIGASLYGAVQPVEESGKDFVPAQTATGPNVILIGIDTLRADALRLYSPATGIDTPRLEAFCQDAVVFEQTSGQASWTKPGFATLFTGLYPRMHTATSKTAALPEEVETLAELLRDAGYYTQGFANNPNIYTMFGFNQGFVDYTELRPRLFFFATPSATKLSMYEVLRKVRQRILQKIGKRFGAMVVTDFYQPAETVTQTALDWIDRSPAPENTPFYLFLHYMDPHDPFMDPSAPGGGYARARMETPEPDQAEAMHQAYLGEVAHLDTYLGTLFDGLRQRGLYDDTLIVAVADHGEEFYEHEGWWHGFTLYDEMVRIPLIIKFPGNAQAGTRNTGLARQVDVAPTILRIAGLDKAPAMPGQALYDPAQGFTNGGIAYSYAENDFEGNELRAIRSRTEKLIHAVETSEERLAPNELYDLEKDPGEHTNLAEDAAHQPQRQALEAVLEDYRKVVEENAAEPAAPAQVDDAAAEQLESLGYLE